MNSPAEITRIPLTIVSTQNGAHTDGVLVGVLAADLDALAARVAIVRPTRDRVHAIIRQCVIDYCHEIGGNVGFPTAIIDDAADAIASAFWPGVAVSDSQETPE